MEIKIDQKRLAQAFSSMAENVNLTVHNTEELLTTTIDDMVRNAKILTEEIYQLSQEEAAFLSEAMKLEIETANDALSEQKQEFEEWLGFDILLVEQKFLDLLEKTADKSWLDFKAFEAEARKNKNENNSAKK
tara:strand:- start:95 stop:493 length:399 start_codon:yes stop_codon:yes gene_type:complete